MPHQTTQTCNVTQKLHVNQKNLYCIKLLNYSVTADATFKLPHCLGVSMGLNSVNLSLL